MSKNENEQSAEKAAPQNLKNASARLMAVQAFYQLMQNQKPVRDVYEEYLEHRVAQVIDEYEVAQPDGALLKRILYGVDERYIEVETIVKANLKKDASDRVVEPLLYAVFMCGAYEILVHTEFDAPIIINDYLNVGHAFFEKNEVALVNGVLDSLVKVLR